MSATIDAGRPFDWGRTSRDYAQYRDIYPEQFFRTIMDLGIGRAGQHVLDLGTGTGVVPRHLYAAGAHWTGLDASPEQIAQAQLLSEGSGIEYLVSSAEDIPLPSASADAVTAAQCFFYFDHDRLAPELRRVLRPSGRLLITYVAWLPEEDRIAAASEELVLRHNPEWSGAGEIFRPAEIPPQYGHGFRLIARQEQRLRIPFTRESWHGRMRACRGTGASLSAAALREWDTEHQAMLAAEAPAEFAVTHCFALALLERT